MQGNTASVIYFVDPLVSCAEYAPGQPLVSIQPRIAYQGNLGQPTVTIAFMGYDYALDTHSCEICTETFDANSMTYLNETDHGGGGHPMDWDIEWNGSDRYILAYVYVFDEDASFVVMSQDYYRDGTLPDLNATQIMDCDYDIENVPYPETIRLVYTYGNMNYYNLFILQSDAVYLAGDYEGTHVGSTYYLSRYGGVFAGSPNPITNYVGNFEYGFAACEYWGEEYRIAHTFVSINQFYYPPPHVVIATRHMHWYYTTSTNNPRDTYGFNDGYWPKACNAADTPVDDEVLVVSRKAPSADPYVYWNIEAQ